MLGSRKEKGACLAGILMRAYVRRAGMLLLEKRVFGPRPKVSGGAGRGPGEGVEKRVALRTAFVAPRGSECVAPHTALYRLIGLLQGCRNSWKTPESF